GPLMFFASSRSPPAPSPDGPQRPGAPADEMVELDPALGLATVTPSIGNEAGMVSYHVILGHRLGLLAREPQPELIDRDGRDQQQVAHDVLPERDDVEQDEPVVDHSDHEHAEDRPDDRPPAACEARSAEDYGGH